VEEPDGRHEKTTFDPLFLNATLDRDEELLLGEFNTTEHKGFLHGFVESLSVILVSELGDKTFFIAAILAMRNNKLTVFLVGFSLYKFANFALCKAVKLHIVKRNIYFA